MANSTMTDPYQLFITEQLTAIAMHEDEQVLWQIESFLDDMIQAKQDGEAGTVRDRAASAAALICKHQERVAQ